MKKITKANTAKFVKAMTAYFLELGAVEKPSDIPNFKRFELETSYGLLHIYFDTEQAYSYNIFGRFENVDLVKQQPWFKGIGNPHSGKYNFNSDNYEVEDAIHDAKIFFNSKDLTKYKNG